MFGSNNTGNNPNYNNNGFNNGGFNNGGFNNGGFNNGGFNNGGFNNGGFNNGNSLNGSGFSAGLGSSFKQTISRVHFSWLFLIFSIIAAALFFVLGEFLYQTFLPNISPILFMGLYFAAFGFILWVFLFLAARINRLKFSLKSIILPLICMIALFGFGTLFEFLYELDFSSAPVPVDNYIFVIDNSGSMDDNDPDQKRIAAVKEILNGKDENFQFAVYSFGVKLLRLRDMKPLSQGIGDLTVIPNGGTPMLGILEKVLDDMNAGEITYNNGTQVILLTDGSASDYKASKLNSITKEFRDKNVTISTVGLGNVDEAFLNTVSGNTGGLSITVDDVSQLGNAMTSVIRSEDTDNNLLSLRTHSDLDWLRGILRVLFLFILGAILTVIKFAVVDESAHIAMILISSGSACLVAALLMEIGLNLFLTGFIGRIILVLLFSIMLTTLERIIELDGGMTHISRL